MEHRGQDGGTYREHELNRDIAPVVDALQTTISELGAHRVSSSTSLTPAKSLLRCNVLSYLIYRSVSVVIPPGRDVAVIGYRDRDRTDAVPPGCLSASSERRAFWCANENTVSRARRKACSARQRARRDS